MRDEGPRDDAHPIVLIHGTGSSLHTWEGWVAALKNQHRIVTLDLPGMGLSDHFPDDDYRIEHYARFVGSFLDGLGIKHTSLGGNSLGGWIAWETALSRPDLVDRLVLIDSVGYPDEAESPPLIFRMAKFSLFRWLIEHVTPRSFIARNLAQAYGDPHKVTPGLVDRYHELFLCAGNRRAFILQFQQEPNTNSDAARVRAITIPTLILWGGRDRIVPVTSAARFHDDIVHSELVVFRELGHAPQEENPVETVKAFEDFLVR